LAQRIWLGAGKARQGAEEGDQKIWGEAGFAFAVCFRLPSPTPPAFFFCARTGGEVVIPHVNEPDGGRVEQAV